MKLLKNLDENQLDDIDTKTLNILKEDLKPILKEAKWLFMVLIFSFIVVPFCIGMIFHSLLIGILSMCIGLVITRLIVMQDMDRLVYLQVELPKMQKRLADFESYLTSKYIIEKEN